MLVYRRAFATAPSLHLSTSGRSIAAPLLRYSTNADAAAAAPVTPVAPTASATGSSPTPQSPRHTPAQSSSSTKKYPAWPKQTGASKAPESRLTPLASRNIPNPAFASPSGLTKGSTTKAAPSITPLKSTTDKVAPLPSVPDTYAFELKSPDHLHWKPISPPVRERPQLEYAKNVDWTTSYHGLGTNPVTPAQFAILCKPLAPSEIEVKPDGILYMPEIRYRRKLNEAFGPMGWGIAPRGEVVVGKEIVTREFALIIDGW